MISIENISIRYGERDLFKSISTVIKDSDRIGLVGHNGAGKSTLLKLLTGEYNADSGRVIIPAKATIGYLPQELKVDYKKSVFEEASTAFEEIKKLEEQLKQFQKELEERTDYESDSYQKLVERFSETDERFHRIGGMGQREEVEKILKGLGFLDGDFDRPVAEFSGGWQMRIELAKILLRQPDYVILDEPTNHLDIESIIWLESFLKPYNGGIVLVSHDRQFLDGVCNRTIEIVNGKIYDYKANYTKFVELRLQRIEQQKSEAKSQEKFVEHTEQLINKFRAKKNKAKFAQGLIRKLERIEKIEVDELDTKKISFRFPPAPRSGKITVKADQVFKSYGDLLVLNGVDFELERQEKIAFVGKNGEGKSTFTRIIAEIDKQFEGALELGHNVEFAYFDQNQAETLDGNLTVFETIDEVATGDMRSRVRNLLGSFLFSGEDQEKKVKVLSGGEKSRLAIAKLLLDPSNLLILDEPTNHLDMRSKEILKQALKNYDGSMIVVSHDREFLKDLTSKVFEFRDNKLHLYYGDVFDFLEKRNLNSFKSLELEKKAKKKKGGDKKEETKSNKGGGKKDSQDRRTLNKEINRLSNRIQKMESKIEKLEKKIAEVEDMIAQAGFFETDGAQTTLADYKVSKEELSTVMEEWESAIEKLENQQAELEKLN